MPHIYLDHNATTPIDAAVADSVHECSLRVRGNPASPHRTGREARRLLEQAREGMAELLGADVAASRADSVVFTSGGTESNNLALHGLAGEPPGRILISAVEHPSVAAAAGGLAARGFDVRQIRVDADGIVDLNHARELLTEPTRLVSVMLGNNETGVLQPVQQLAQLCVAAGTLLHTDAVQVVGKLPVDFRAVGVAALSASAHKFHGPPGVGLLLVRAGITLQPILLGGFQQLGLRPGTEAVALAVGMHTALQLAAADQQRASRMQQLRDQLEAAIQQGDPAAVIHAQSASRLPHTSNVSFPGLDRQAILMALDLAGVACSTGSACASGSSEPSPVLLAMGCHPDVVEGSIRISLGMGTTDRENAEAGRRILDVVHHLRGPREHASHSV